VDDDAVVAYAFLLSNQAVVAQEKRVVNQQIPSAVPADTRRYAAVREGTKTA